MFNRSFFKNNLNDEKNSRSQFYLGDDEGKNEIYNKLNSENIKAFIELVSDNKSAEFSDVRKIAQTFKKIGYFISEFDEITTGYAEFEKACSRYDNMVERYRRTLKSLPQVQSWDPDWLKYRYDNSLSYIQTKQELSEMKDQMWPPRVRGYEGCDTLRDGEGLRNAKIRISQLWDEITPSGSAETVRNDRLDQLHRHLPRLIKESNDTISLLDKSDEISNLFPGQAYVVKKACEEIREIALQFIRNVKGNDVSETRHFRPV